MNNDASARPSGPAMPHQTSFPVSVQAGDYELKTIVMDFAPGAVVPDHTHGGAVFGLVLSGEITLRTMSGARVLRAGEGWAEDSSAVHSAANESREPARIVVNVLLPKGALTTIFA